jgi:hypothetical protein
MKGSSGMIHGGRRLLPIPLMLFYTFLNLLQHWHYDKPEVLLVEPTFGSFDVWYHD